MAAILCVAVLIALYFGNSHPWILFVLSLPISGSLLALIGKLFLDDLAHQRAIYLQDQKNHFVLGATSHMAIVTFDKHVEFCEQYIHEAYLGLKTLFEKGPNEDALNHSGNLGVIRQNFAIWLTDKYEKQLTSFEDAFRQVGAAAMTLRTAQDMQARPGSLPPNIIDNMYRDFARIMGWRDWRGEELTDEAAVSSLVRELRRLLGTEELSTMRAELVGKAVRDD